MHLEVLEASREILPSMQRKLGPLGTIAKALRERKRKAAKKAGKSRVF
jgi:hypothetical protein